MGWGIESVGRREGKGVEDAKIIIRRTVLPTPTPNQDKSKIETEREIQIDRI